MMCQLLIIFLVFVNLNHLVFVLDLRLIRTLESRWPKKPWSTRSVSRWLLAMYHLWRRVRFV